MAYQGVDWQNKPSTASPINRTNLEIMDNGIVEADANATAAKTEVEDVRIGADGTVYQSAGNAVRAQVNELTIGQNVYDIFNANNVTFDRAVKNTGIVTKSGLYVTTYIPLENAKYIAVADNVGSNLYGHIFYDENYNIIPNSFVAGQGTGDTGTGILLMEIPENSKYVVVTGVTARINKQKIYISFDYDKMVDFIEYTTEYISSLDSSIKNDISGSIMLNTFVTFDANEMMGYYSVNNSKCVPCDVSNLIGKEIIISTKQVSLSYRLLYMFVNRNGFKIESGSGSSTEQKILTDEKVIVPPNAFALYVNCANDGNVSIKTFDVKSLYNYPEFHIYGKSIVTYGDSLTWYDENKYTWGIDQNKICIGYQTYLRNFLKMSTTNRGVSGKSTPQICETIKNANDLTDFDYMTIMGGDNDDRLNIEIGTLLPIGSTFDTSTVYGALQSAIEYALSQNPELRIILMTEPMGWTYRNGIFERVSDLIPNAYRRVAEQYGLPLIDNWLNSGINEFNRNIYFCDPSDDNQLYFYHPNNSGWERISRYICEKMKNK